MGESDASWLRFYWKTVPGLLRIGAPLRSADGRKGRREWLTEVRSIMVLPPMLVGSIDCLMPAKTGESEWTVAMSELMGSVR